MFPQVTARRASSEFHTVVVLLLKHYRRITLLHKTAFEFRVPGLQKIGEDSNVTGNITGNIIYAIGVFAVTKGQSRVTAETENAGGQQGRGRAGAPCLLRTATSGAVNDEKPAIKFDDGFDVGFQSKSV